MPLVGGCFARALGRCWSPLLCLVLLLLLVSGCEDEAGAATALVVSVRSDLADLATVELAVFEASADPRKATPGDKQLTDVPAQLRDLPISIVVNQGKASEVMLAVRGLDKRGKRLVEARTRARFAAGKSLAVHVFLGEVCRDVPCDDAPKQTCRSEATDAVAAGECAGIPVLHAEDLSPVTIAGAEHDWEPPDDQARDGSMDGQVSETDAGTGVSEDTGAVSSPDSGGTSMMMSMTSDAAASGPDGGAEAGTSDAGANDASVDASATPDAGSDAGPQCAKPPLASAACGLFPQCGCPAGQACRLTGAQATSCSPIGTIGATAACSQSADCPAGYDCIGGRCAGFCASDADCAGTGSVCLDINFSGAPVSGARACILACNRTNSAPCGAGIACARLTGATISGRTLTGNFCLKPSMDCPFKADGRCDEPEDGRACVDGSDATDCTVCTPPNPPGGTCDVVSQCGCTGGQACAHNPPASGSTTATVSCRAPGSVAREGFCNFLDDCSAGTTCVGSVCRRYCTLDADCTGGALCSNIYYSGVPTPGLRTCFTACDPNNASACAAGTVCDNDPTQVRHLCSKPSNPCPTTLTANGRCDGPEGSRLCAAGTDPECTGG
jgi:hypothetical protein